ncbi:ribosomal RNA small subunit methyltransferase B [Sulfurimicrobium lacus]|uniref:16S rRNA (cytosine(967)-C(5))-methyltransferase n=1 Tax=Sulfurimicrobium lacus TaxID=2715678 RepID=A0A6F8V8M2_9PROT|nr:16S rRNA (cytosine(967)-C(5))-methyltransferase RsmB [Sulfurimicrobium lacus]BCB25125.1 ribosomal RNA small subunit methyltransferase B [Sulfurimicrobium lacus]
MLDAQRLAALAVAQVLAGRNLNQVLQKELARHPQLTPQQRAMLQDLSYGTLRHYGTLQAVLGALLQKPLQDESIRALLLVALYQLAYTHTQSHAVVDHAVRVTVQALRKTSAKGLVNAILRNFLRRREALLADAAAAGEEARHGHPQWWIDKLRSQYPQQWEEILACGNQHPPMALRVNRRLGNAQAYLDQLSQVGIVGRALAQSGILLEQPVAVDRLPGFSAGQVSVQDGGAQLAASLLDVADGMRVLDACSAPGGKTAHLLELADLDLTALDHDSKRLQKVEQNLRRLGFKAECLVGDAAEPQKWWNGKPFQRILADVPCSASGVVRRHPDIKWLRRESDIAQFAAQQAAILDALWRCLEQGGKLLYVTCSVFAEENSRQVAAFLQRHGDAELLPLPGRAEQDLQLLPDQEHDGFYYALLAKL